MNPQFITTTNVNNNSDNTKETKSQPCMSDSVTKSDNTFFGDKHLPEGHITTHPFSLTLEELSGLLKNGQGNSHNSEVLQQKPHKNSRVSTDYSVEKFTHNSVEDSRKNNKSTSVGQLSDSPINCQKAQPPQTILNQESRVSTDYSVEKFSNKPVGGSGWLHKYTKLTETKTGLVEYPRVKEGQRSTNDPKHWYWNYCWHKKGKNGKPLYKKGKAVVSSVGCPQKKVREVERAIAARLPHRQILELIKGNNSPPT
ncbi:MAG: hypothetical protein F6K08_07785 [Okeania sp. SIO1H6]|nr:hypothetical protein [Okeania sp. SIO1H6]